jgi:hypothetical protein
MKNIKCQQQLVPLIVPIFALQNQVQMGMSTLIEKGGQVLMSKLLVMQKIASLLLLPNGRAACMIQGYSRIQQ